MATPPDDTLLTIGELAEHTGLSTQLLRTWETRFGFPEPTRLPSGHRRYTGADVRAVRRVLEERDRGTRLEQAIGVARRAEDATHTGSVYASLSLRHPELTSYVVRKDTLLALSWAIEDEATAQAARGVLVGTFQRGRYFGQSAARWRDLARTARGALVMADFPEHDDDARPAQVALGVDSPLLREWIVVHDAPTFAAALVAWELPGQGDVREADRQFEALWTVEGRIVRDVAVICAEAAVAEGSGAARDLLRLLEESATPPATSQRSATAVFNRMVAYTDGTTLRTRTR
ncbi:DICT sensory domain-containing protein [Nocardioides sp. GXQ0305]|uniref:DICT sensory domain-containing protein n=1 Tax=Nocardioides sp. GXQ0305 TaxID=3423912 RepID=UPI003D7D5853